MATLATQAVSPAGTTIAYAAASAGGDACEASGDLELRVKNGSGGSLTVTVASPVPCNQGSTHNLVVPVAAGAEVAIGPLKPERFASPTTGLVTITYSGVTSLTVAAVRV
jgi:N-acetylmuramic acid 6-phosphate (MurNAc-6-P) etherase